MYPGGYLPQYVYLAVDSEKKTFLNEASKKAIFQVFCHYERYKVSKGAYDLMDAVNYILSKIKYVIILF
jgi:hypothetical protein